MNSETFQNFKPRIVKINCTNCDYRQTFHVLKPINTIQYWCRKCHANNVKVLSQPETLI